ncbi:pentatricopeptide repeat-containing protein 1, mitochondrial [Culicoides brevitarsis]|uniref:pentatricopeptide repeat-containing protein 1, mitochondrial n=1 Tax=Culicoides brevitarsis TaxID=469753 RepID=UPI00307BCC17
MFRSFYRAQQISTLRKSVKLMKLNEEKFHTTPIRTVKKAVDDESFLLRRSDSDLFGDLGGPQVQTNELDDDDKTEERLNQNSIICEKKIGILPYADMMKNYIKQKKIHEALSVLEQIMLKEHRIAPTNYIYNILIGGCAHLGYDKKAFQLFANMKQRQLKITGATYTNLFNACANSPFPKTALQKALNLRETLLLKGIALNESNYNSMIKAFGRCGDLETAFRLVDEMQTKKLAIRVETYNFLLQACASDRELGFRHALVIWHKMHRRRMKFDYFSFNLMLRCVRDCGLGNVKIAAHLLREIAELSAVSKISLKIETRPVETEKKIMPNNSKAIAKVDFPNLLTKSPQIGNLISIKEVTNSEERMLLLGGVTGFLAEMDKQNVNPDIKMFTQLLDIIASTTETENKLLQIIKERDISCDIDFFNVLIKKRAFRNDFEAANPVLDMIKTAGLRPDIVTYGVLSLACKTKEDAQTLINDMEYKCIPVNIEILGGMLKKAIFSKDLCYISYILRLIDENNFKPNPILIKNIYKIKHVCSKIIKEKEDGYSTQQNVIKEHMKITSVLNNYMKRMNIKGLSLDEAIKKYRIHPYSQFKDPTELEGFEEEKNKNRKNWKKPRGRIKKSA